MLTAIFSCTIVRTVGTILQKAKQAKILIKSHDDPLSVRDGFDQNHRMTVVVLEGGGRGITGKSLN